MTSKLFSYFSNRTIKLQNILGASILIFISLALSLLYVITLDNIQKKSFALIDFLENKYNLDITYESYQYGFGSITFQNLSLTGSLQAKFKTAIVKIKPSDLLSNTISLYNLSLIRLDSGNVELNQNILAADNFSITRNDPTETLESSSKTSLTNHLLSVLEIKDINLAWLHPEHPVSLTNLNTKLNQIDSAKKISATNIKWKMQTLFEDVRISLTSKKDSKYPNRSHLDVSLTNKATDNHPAGINLNVQIFPDPRKSILDVEFENLPSALMDSYLGNFIANNPKTPFKIVFQSTIQSTEDGFGGLVEVKTSKLPIKDIRLSNQEIALDSRTKFRLLWIASQNRFNIENGFTEIGKEKQKIWFSTNYSPNSGESLELGIKIHSTSCENILQSVPSELIPNIQNFKLNGKLSTEIKLNVNLSHPEKFEITNVDTNFNCNTISIPYAFSVERLGGDFQYENLYNINKPLQTMGSNVSTPNYTPLVQISDNLIRSVINLEDKNFFRHKGFEWNSIEAAIRQNLKTKKFQIGASTLTMQLAKNLFLDRTKNLARKIQEAFLTWHLEEILSKERILEIYLNYVEFGPGIFGITQGANFYFAKHPAKLSEEEALVLAKGLPSPHDNFKQICDPTIAKKKIREFHSAFKDVFQKSANANMLHLALTSIKKRCNTSIALGAKETDTEEKIR